MEHSATPVPPLVNGASEFEISIGKATDPWHASNGNIGVTVYDSDLNVEPSIRLTSGVPALIFKANHVHGIGSGNTWRKQYCIAELNGVFTHVVEQDGQVHIIVSDHRLD